MQDNDFDDDFRPSFDLRQFRWTAARFIKHLIRARWKCEPGFLSVDQLARWKIRNISDDLLPAHQLLRLAAQDLAELNSQYDLRCPSGGIRPTSDSTPEGRLIGVLFGLVQTEGSSPEFNQALLSAADDLCRRNPVDWESLVAWQDLPAIRDDLDQLPEPETEKKVDARDSVRAAETAPNLFRWTGDSWNVRFKGGDLRSFRNLKGMRYIRQLLESPSSQLWTNEMHAALVRWENSAAGGTSAKHKESLDGDIEIEGCRDGGDVLDGEGKKRLEERLLRIKQDRMTAKKDNDVAKQLALDEEWEKVELELQRARRPSGRSSKMKDPVKQFRDKIRKAINGSIDAIQRSDKPLANHLRRFIDTGAVCVYRPEGACKQSCVTGGNGLPSQPVSLTEIAAWMRP